LIDVLINYFWELIKKVKVLKRQKTVFSFNYFIQILCKVYIFILKQCLADDGFHLSITRIKTCFPYEDVTN